MIQENEDINSKPYVFTTNNIKFPTYYNKELEDLLQEEVSCQSFKTSFNLFMESIQKFDTNYFNYLKSNSLEIITLFTQNNKNPMSYLLIAKGIKKLCCSILTQIKRHNNEDEEIILSSNQTLDQIVNDYYTENGFSDLVKQCYPNQEEVRDLLQDIFNFQEIILNSNHPCGLVIIDTAVKYCTVVFNEAITSLLPFQGITFHSNTETKDQRRTNDILLYEFILKLEKIKNVSLCLFNSFNVNENDILNKSESSPEWISLKKILVRVVPQNDLEIKAAIDQLRAAFGVMNVMINDCFTSTNNFINLCKMLKLGIYYKFKSEEATFDSLKLSINPNPNSPLIMCNLLKIWFMKKMAVRTYPKIQFRKKIYLKRMEKEITLEYINIINNYIFGKSNEFLSDQMNQIVPEQIIINHDSSKKGSELYLEKIKKEKKPQYISTRLLHTSYITFTQELLSSCCLCSSSSNPNMTQDTLIIHLHGGGFIGTTTITHESYLRNWVNRLNIPLIGIDYSLSPQSQYPKAIDDCWQAYNWIIKHAEEEFNIKLKRVILSGDSAGGSLALSLTYLLLIHQVRLPDLLLLEYPCCDTSTTNMTNSMLLCMQDHLLSYNFLTYCNKAYRSNCTIDEDPFLNPERIPDNILMKMPRTRFFIGTCDPLRDGSIRLLYKLSKTKVDCKGFDFKNYIHGFYALSSDVLKQNPTEILYQEIEQLINETNLGLNDYNKSDFDEKSTKNQAFLDKII